MKEDCAFYGGRECKALNEMMCRDGACPFYKKNGAPEMRLAHFGEKEEQGSERMFS